MKKHRHKTKDKSKKSGINHSRMKLEKPSTNDSNPKGQAKASIDNSQAQTIGTAEVGQIISPSITSKIGKAHNAEYLIQGNIINMGSGSWQSDYEHATRDMPFDKTTTKAGISIQVDLRIIKASTGEVIWKKTATGTKINERIDAFIFSIGSSKLTSELYTKALEDAVEQISNALITDYKAHKLFVK